MASFGTASPRRRMECIWGVGGCGHMEAVLSLMQMVLEMSVEFVYKPLLKKTPARFLVRYFLYPLYLDIVRRERGGGGRHLWTIDSGIPELRILLLDRTGPIPGKRRPVWRGEYMRDGVYAERIRHLQIFRFLLLSTQVHVTALSF